MAARLVWLVANGMVRPDRVLGLTFTRKAAAELADRIRARLDGAAPRRARGQPGRRRGRPWAGDPVISTYHSYAGRLVSDHALREGLEPSMRLITAALSWQLAAVDRGRLRRADGRGAVDAADGDRGGARAGGRPRRAPAVDRATCGAWGSGWTPRRPAGRAGACPGCARSSRPSGPGSSCCRWSTATPRPSWPARCSTTGTRSGWRRGSPCATRRSAPPSAPATRWCCSMSTRTPATRSSSCLTPSSATGTRSPRSATRASRSTAGAARARATCAGSPMTSRPGRETPAPVQKLSTSFRNAGRVLDAAAVAAGGAAGAGAGRAAARARARPRRARRRVRGAAARR